MTDPAAPTTRCPDHDHPNGAFCRNTTGLMTCYPPEARSTPAETHEHRWTASTQPGAAPGLPGSTCADPDCPNRRSTPAETLDVERLTEAMDFDRVEALSIIEKHGFIFATDPSKPIENRTDSERWEALAFTLYTMLLPSNRRSERIAAEYARLRSPESD